jgi:hypothetical protein
MLRAPGSVIKIGGSVIKDRGVDRISARLHAAIGEGRVAILVSGGGAREGVQPLSPPLVVCATISSLPTASVTLCGHMS